MDEELWLRGTSVEPLLNFAESDLSFRKFGLAHTACCRVFTEGWERNHPLVAFIPKIEAILEGESSGSDADGCMTSLSQWIRDSSQLLLELLQETRGKLRKNVLDQGREAAACFLLSPLVDSNDRWWRSVTTMDDELLYTHYQLTRGCRVKVFGQNIALLRDIFGNPFRPITFASEWRSDTALSLAKHIYEARDFSTMPILADALQDAGCDNADILSHCRDPQQVHVRGCWVVDLVLGKA